MVGLDPALGTGEGDREDPFPFRPDRDDLRATRLVSGCNSTSSSSSMVLDGKSNRSTRCFFRSFSDSLWKDRILRGAPGTGFSSILRSVDQTLLEGGEEVVSRIAKLLDSALMVGRVFVDEMVRPLCVIGIWRCTV